MTLTPGTHLGRYEIRSKLGAGGMGEVHLAEDTRLHRKVALKSSASVVLMGAFRLLEPDFMHNLEYAEHFACPQSQEVAKSVQSAEPLNR